MPTTLGPLTDFPIDKPTPVTIDGDKYLVIRPSENPDEVCIVSDRCPHAGLSLSRGPRADTRTGSSPAPGTTPVSTFAPGKTSTGLLASPASRPLNGRADSSRWANRRRHSPSWLRRSGRPGRGRPLKRFDAAPKPPTKGH